MSVAALFIGPDDSETCDTGGPNDEGCEGAVNNNPYTLETVPEPGTAGACQSRCRHMVQIDGDAPDDVETVDWSARIGFGVADEAADAAAKYHPDNYRADGSEIADEDLPAKDVGDQSVVMADSFVSSNADTLGELLTSGASAEEIASYIDADGGDEAKMQASAGFSDSDSAQAYYLADAMNETMDGDWQVVLRDGRWYVEDANAD